MCGRWGDSATVPDLVTGGTCPPTAQYALRQGRRLADNIAAVLQGESPQPFRFQAVGLLASLGRRSAVAEIFGLRFSGFVAWWLWRTIYLMKLPGFERKLRVAIDWTLDLFFPRDIVYLRPLHAAGGRPSVSRAESIGNEEFCTVPRMPVDDPLTVLKEPSDTDCSRSAIGHIAHLSRPSKLPSRWHPTV